MKDVVETLQKLPVMVFTRLRSTGQVIAIRRGVMGYYPIETRRAPEILNEPGVTKAQIAAMESGSMFGWEIPAADPDNYDADGNIDLEKIRRVTDGLKGWNGDAPR